MKQGITSPSKVHFSDVPELQEMLETARNFSYKDGITKRLKLYKTIEQKADELGLEIEKTHAFALLAKYFIDHQQYSKALQYIFQGLPLAQKHKLNARISNFYNWLAGVHYFIGDYSNALDYFQLEIKHNVQVGLEHHSFSAYNLIGIIYYEMGDYQTSELFYQKALDIAQKHPDFLDVFASTAHLNTGLIVLRIAQEQYDDAKKLCYETIKLIADKKINDKRLLPNLYSSLALISYDLGKYNEGISYALEADKNKDGASVEEILYVYKVLALNYAKAGNTKQALATFDKFIRKFSSASQVLTSKIETLRDAKTFYESIGEDTSELQNIIVKAEFDYQINQSKLAIRAEQLLAITAKYAPAGLKPDSGKILLPVVGLRITEFIIEKIVVCETLSGEENRNKSSLAMYQNPVNYKIPMSLRNLYSRINHPDFVWINRNVFLNKNYVDDWEKAVHTGRVILNRKTYSMSRRIHTTLKKEMKL